MSVTALTRNVKEFSTKETAAAMRAALKAAFPGIKFSVRMDRGTAHGWLNVSWEDGPTESDVKDLCDSFRSSRFDGSDDSYHRIEPTMLMDANGEITENRYSCRGVDCSRRFSAAATAYGQQHVPAEFLARIAEQYGPDSRELSVTAWLSTQDLTEVAA